MKESKVKSSKQNQAVLIALIVSAVLTAVFVQDMFGVARNAVQSQILGAPNSFAGWPAGILALYVFFAGNRLRYKFAAVIILTLLVSAVAFWLFGLTSAGDSLMRL